MFRSFRHEFDPLDLEILERALNATWAAVKDNRNDPPADFDSNEGLETILKRELIETARFNGVSDPGPSPRPTTKSSCRRVPCLRANVHNALHPGEGVFVLASNSAYAGSGKPDLMIAAKGNRLAAAWRAVQSNGQRGGAGE